MWFIAGLSAPLILGFTAAEALSLGRPADSEMSDFKLYGGGADRLVSDLRQAMGAAEEEEEDSSSSLEAEGLLPSGYEASILAAGSPEGEEPSFLQFAGKEEEEEEEEALEDEEDLAATTDGFGYDEEEEDDEAALEDPAASFFETEESLPAGKEEDGEEEEGEAEEEEEEDAADQTEEGGASSFLESDEELNEEDEDNEQVEGWEEEEEEAEEGAAEGLVTADPYGPQQAAASYLEEGALAGEAEDVQKEEEEGEEAAAAVDDEEDPEEEAEAEEEGYGEGSGSSDPSFLEDEDAAAEAQAASFIQLEARRDVLRSSPSSSNNREMHAHRRGRLASSGVQTPLVPYDFADQTEAEDEMLSEAGETRPRKSEEYQGDAEASGEEESRESSRGDASEAGEPLDGSGSLRAEGLSSRAEEQSEENYAGPADPMIRYGGNSDEDLLTADSGSPGEEDSRSPAAANREEGTADSLQQRAEEAGEEQEEMPATTEEELAADLQGAFPRIPVSQPHVVQRRHVEQDIRMTEALRTEGKGAAGNSSSAASMATVFAAAASAAFLFFL